LSGSSPGANDNLLMVIASVLLGVVFSRRLVPSIGGTLISVLFLSLIANGFQLINISSYWINGVEGLLILLVVSLTAVLRQRQQRRKVRV
jgi:ribose transport system permease protein